MKYFKKPVKVKFEIYKKSGMEDTREGKSPYEVGDYKMTGIEGEVWPMKPNVFSDNYKVIDKENGIAIKRKVIVDVKFAEGPTQVSTAWGALLKAKEGDAIVSASAEDRWIVTRSIFDATYEPYVPEREE